MRVKAKTVKLSLCSCGYSVLHDDIPLGTEYEVDPSLTAAGTLTCGGCHKTFHIESIFAFNRNGPGGGFLPRDLFEIHELPLTVRRGRMD